MENILPYKAELLKSHNGTLTIHNTRSGGHRTFKIRTQADDANFAPGQRIISLLVGPDNTADYEGFGFVNGSKISVWRKKENGHFPTYAKMIMRPELYPSCEYLFSVKCSRCNRELTDPYSIEYGMGPICREK